MLTQEDEEVLWWLLQRNAAAAAAAAAAAPAGMPAGIDDLEPEEGCLGAGASPGAAQELCLNYDDFTQAGGRNALGTLHSAEPLLGWAAVTFCGGGCCRCLLRWLCRWRQSVGRQ